MLDVPKVEKDDENMDKVSVKVDGKIIADGLLGKKAGVTYVPLQAVADTLGASVEWDSKTKTA